MLKILPRLSVIIPVHNSEDTIRKCVNSIVQQEEINNYEIILIENGSIDGSDAICRKFAAENKHVVYHTNSKIGVSAARNQGIEKATGEIITFCDADDFINPHTLKELLYIFNENPQIDVVVSGYMYIYEKLNKTRRKYYKNSFGCVGADFAEMILRDDRIFGGVWNKFYRRRYIGDIRFDEKLSYCEDVKFNVETALENSESKIYISNIISYNYVQTLKSVTNNPKNLLNVSGQLNPVIALKMLREKFSEKEKIYMLISRKIYIFSVNALRKGQKLSIEQQNLIKKDIKDNKKYFLKCWVVCPKENLKVQMQLLLGKHWQKIRRSILLSDRKQ